MDEKTKTKYLKHPFLCPFCHSDDIEAQSIDQTDITSKQTVVCHACNSEWKDIYKLVDLEEIQ